MPCGSHTRGSVWATHALAPAASATARQNPTVTWQVSNQTNLAFTGSWLDSVYLSLTPTLTNSSILLGSTQENGVAAGGTYHGSLTAPLLNVPPGAYSPLAAVASLYRGPAPNPGHNNLSPPRHTHLV